MTRRSGGGLIERLRERGVLRVAISYAVIAWLVLQIADVVLAPWELPPWVLRAPLVIAALGFPIAIALAWFLELGDSGVVRDTATAGDARPATHGARRYVDVAVISVLGAIVAFFVLRDAGWLGDAVRPGPKVESSSIAVLPFANLGGEAERHVSDGLSDELRSQFSRMQSLRVTARSSSVAFQGIEPPLDAVAIAGKLAVAALLEGTVGRDQGRLRVSVQLVNGRDGKVMWAERFDRPDHDLLAVQSEIAGAVVAAVLPRFAASGQAAPPPPTEDPVAYDLYLLGREKLRESERSGNSYDEAGARTSATQAAELFRSAVAADPGFAQAHASLARVQLPFALAQVDAATREQQAAEVDRLVMPDIERALELDPKNAEAWYVKGVLLTNTIRPGATEAFTRAVELDPSHSLATMALGWSALAEGRVDERYRLVRRALDLDPMELRNHGSAVIGAWALGRGDDVRSIVDRMLRLFPDSAPATEVACWAGAEVGELADGIACVHAAISRFGAEPDIVAQFELQAAELYEVLGRDEWAQRHYERAAARIPETSAALLRLRRDVPGLRRLAGEWLQKRMTIYDAGLADDLARAGLGEEALAIYRHAGMPDLMGPSFRTKPMFIHEYLQMIALMRQHGDADEAKRHLDLADTYVETVLRHGGRNFGLRLASSKVHALAGRSDAALEQLRLAVEAMDSPAWSATSIEADPVFAEQRDDPRFRAQMKLLREQQARLTARLPEAFKQRGLAWPPA